MLTRRDFVGATAASLGVALLTPAPVRAGSAADGSPLYASCAMTGDGSFAVAVLDKAGAVRVLHPLPARGHDVAVDAERGVCVAFARRPGTFAVAFDISGRRPPTVVAAAPGRHFFGHGVFSADGGLMYATENDIATGEGKIGLYDTRDSFARVGELATGGIGPHELVLCADMKTLAVANGGLDTDPAFGRRNIDVAGMRSSLTLVDTASGEVGAEASAGSGLDLLSIRHLALGRDGSLWFGCQHEGDPMDLPPLVGRRHPSGVVTMLELPDDIRAGPRNYIGSVAASGDGSIVAVSAPKGGLVLGFDAATGRFLGARAIRDVCGLAPCGDGLLATSGAGTIDRIGKSGSSLGSEASGRADLAFDNHLAQIA